MKYYEQLLLMGCFHFEEIYKITGNKNTAKALIRSYLQKGYIQSVKRNLYVAINLADNMPVSNSYVIGSHITNSSYISHHSAFSYYGYTNQVMNTVNISSKTEFRHFEFQEINYHYILSRIDEGVIKQPDGVRVTDLERTVIDSINDFEKIGGLEELLRSLSLIPVLDEQKLLQYLKCYNKQVLFQKTGYLLEQFRKELLLSDGFFESCKNGIGRSIQIFSKNMSKSERVYHQKWQLFVPKELIKAITEGGFEDAEI